MATDCSSEKPSSCSLWTNLSVSKWWSLLLGAEAWNDRLVIGLRMSARILLQLGAVGHIEAAHMTELVYIVFGDVFHFAAVPTLLFIRDCSVTWNRMGETARDAFIEGGPCQLSRGRRNLGRV